MGKVKFKYGSYADYDSVRRAYGEDHQNVPNFEDTLYFVTDRGIIFKGETIVTHCVGITQQTDTGGLTYVTITDNSGSNVRSYNVYTKAAVDALLATHAAIHGNGNLTEEGEAAGFGHVALTDTINNGPAPSHNPTTAPDGVATTPRAVQQAIADAISEFSSAVNLSDLNDDVVAHGYTPDTGAEDFRVTLDHNDRPSFNPETGGLIAIKFTGKASFNGHEKKADIDGRKFLMLHRGVAIGAGQIVEGDTATFLAVHVTDVTKADGKVYQLHLISVDRPIDTEVTQNSNHLITSGAVYDAIADACPEWSTIS